MGPAVVPGSGLNMLAEARKAWGDQIVIWGNFPESFFWEGAEATRRHAVDLLRSDLSACLIPGMTTIGASVIADEEAQRVFGDGMNAIMDAIGDTGSLWGPPLQG